MSTTFVISDLHLGSRDGSDVLRHDPAALDALVTTLDGVQRLVLLGDLLELRHAPAREVLAAARPVLQRLGAAVEEVVIVAGNHDHALVEGWLEEQAREAPPRLGLEQRIAPARASWVAGQVAEALGVPASVAYPGLWLREDTYALHGHYLDLHTDVADVRADRRGGEHAPARPGTAAGHAQRLRGAPGAGVRLAGRGGRLGAPGAGQRLVRRGGRGVPRADRRTRGGLRSLLLAGGFPVAVAAINRAGLGPVRPDIRGPALRRASLEAMHAVVGHLQIDAAHVLFGHSHRTGPLPGDDRAEWGRLLNVGSWVVGSPTSETTADSPYRAGGGVRVGASTPPVLERVVWE